MVYQRRVREVRRFRASGCKTLVQPASDRQKSKLSGLYTLLTGAAGLLGPSPALRRSAAAPVLQLHASVALIAHPCQPYSEAAKPARGTPDRRRELRTCSPARPRPPSRQQNAHAHEHELQSPARGLHAVAPAQH